MTLSNVSETQEDKQRLESTGAYLQTIVDTVRSPLLVIDGDLKVVSASRSFYRDFQTAADAIEGRYIYEIGDGAWSSPTLLRLLEQVSAERTEVENFELQIEIADRSRTMLLDARWLVDPNNQRRPMILLAMEDITEQRRAVDEQFQAFLEDSPDPAVVVNPDCEIQFVNEHAMELFGYPREGLIGMQVEMLMPERFRGRHFELQKSYFAAPRTRPMGAGLDIVGLTNNDREVPLEVSLSPVEIGGRTMARAVVRDITARKKAEQALKESERRFRAFMERAQLICVTLDCEGKILFCNEYLLSLTGWRQDEVEGENWFELFIPVEDREKRIEAFKRSMMQGEVALPKNFENPILTPNYENPILTRTGQRRLVAWNAALVHDAEGRVVGCTSVGNDITQQRQAQEALEAAKLEAERANALKSRFLAATSHDLRQPLQTLGLLHGVLARTVKDDGSRGAIESLGTTIASMGSTIDALLDINQLESGAVTPEVIDFAVSSVLTKVLSECTPYAEGKGLELRIVPCSAVIRSDPRLLERLVENLVSNAIKYTENGKVLVGCRWGDGTLRIEVWDMGVGIPEDQIEAIFEEYYQLDNPARERSRGLGLGLTVVQRMADLLGHRIEVRSTPGCGSMFAVAVPLGRAQRRHPEGEAPDVVAATGWRICVLLVEDDLAVRESLELFLRLYGYEVMAATTADEALSWVVDGAVRPGILIADHNLPGGTSGLELVDRLRAQMACGLPAIVLTGDASAETMSEITARSAVYLRKPADADRLLRLIEQQIGERRKPHERTRAGGAATRDEARAKHPGRSVISVVDDDRSIRDAIRMLLEASGYCVEIFATAEAFLERDRAERPDCLLVDVGMPGMNGLELQERLNAEGAAIPVIVITGRQDVPLAVQAMRAGAIDFLQKPFDNQILLGAVERALAQAPKSSDRTEALSRLKQLTSREHEVLRLIVAGQANKQVAATLGISPRTAENHRGRIMEKSGARSLAELVRLALAAGVEIEAANRSD